MMQTGVFALIGLVLTRQLPQMVLGARNSGIIGYVANFAAAMVSSFTASKVAKKKTGQAVMIGGMLYLVNRIISEQFAPVGKVLSLAGLGGKKAKYVGGTITTVKPGAKGTLEVNLPETAVFVSNKGSFLIPYESITSLEYGQQAERPVGTAIALGATTLGLAALPLLLTKNRKHYLTIRFTDENGTEQGAVLELGKKITRVTLSTMEVRSGIEIEYQSEEARKHQGN